MLNHGREVTGSMLTAFAHWLAVPLALLVLVAHSQGFFPTEQGLIGHDYAYYLPYLLAGRYWAEVNGYWSVPDAIAVFCGGIPWLANPQSLYFSLPQWLSFVVDPVTAVWWTYLLACLFGAGGVFLLSRKAFRTSSPAAVLIAVLFLLNGLLEARLAAGHLPKHALALLPWLAYASLAVPIGLSGYGRWFGRIGAACAVGIGVAYMVYAGIPHLVLQTALVLAIILCTHALRFGPSLGPWMVLGLGALISVPLALPKLLPAAQWMAQFPEGGANMLGLLPVSADGVSVLLRGLFLPGALPETYGLVGSSYLMGLHEFDYSVTMVPLLIILVAALNFLGGWGRGERQPQLQPRSSESLSLIWSALTLLLLVPLLLSFGNAQWSETLRALPYLGSASLNARWWLVWVLPLLLLTALAFDSLRWLQARGPVVALALALLAMVQVFGFGPDWAALTTSYDPAPVRAAMAELDRTGKVVPVSTVGGMRLSLQGTGHRLGPNDGIVVGYCSYACYEPVFGYDLRNLPFRGPSGAAPVLDQHTSQVWLTNPGCYLRASLHDCPPGTLLPADAPETLTRFTHYRALPPGIMPDDAWLRSSSLIAWLLALGLTALYLAWALHVSIRRHAVGFDVGSGGSRRVTALKGRQALLDQRREGEES